MGRGGKGRGVVAGEGGLSAVCRRCVWLGSGTRADAVSCASHLQNSQNVLILRVLKLQNPHFGLCARNLHP